MQMITIMGFLPRDPEVKQNKNGDPYGSFSVGVRAKKNDEVVWYSVYLKSIPPMFNYLKKGSHVLVVGDLSPNAVSPGSGEANLSMRIFAHNIRIMPKPQEKEGENP